jgi:AraC-like DNA-binding protein
MQPAPNKKYGIVLDNVGLWLDHGLSKIVINFSKKIIFDGYMKEIFIIGATLAFFLAFLIFMKKNKTTADYMLGAYLVVLCLYFITLKLRIEGYYNLGISIGFRIPLLLGPFLFLYTLTMIKRDNRFKASYLIHALPFLLFNLYFITIQTFPSLHDLVIGGKLIEPFITTFMISFYLGINIIYIAWSFVLLKHHKKKLVDNFSYTEEVDLNWVKYVLILFGLFWLFVIILHFFDKYPLPALSPLGSVIYIGLTLYVFLMGYFGLKQQAIYSYIPVETTKMNHSGLTNKTDEKYKHSTLHENEITLILEKLLAYFNSEKPYLDAKLKLSDLAEKLEISTHHLSQAINEKAGKNFYDFINDYRIEEVKSRLHDPENNKFTILSVAYDCGFNSKSSFNSVFKKNTGLSPSQYLNQKNIAS